MAQVDIDEVIEDEASWVPIESLPTPPGERRCGGIGELLMVLVHEGRLYDGTKIAFPGKEFDAVSVLPDGNVRDGCRVVPVEAWIDKEGVQPANDESYSNILLVGPDFTTTLLEIIKSPKVPIQQIVASKPRKPVKASKTVFFDAVPREEPRRMGGATRRALGDLKNRLAEKTAAYDELERQMTRLNAIVTEKTTAYNDLERQTARIQAAIAEKDREGQTLKRELDEVRKLLVTQDAEIESMKRAGSAGTPHAMQFLREQLVRRDEELDEARQEIKRLRVAVVDAMTGTPRL
jgi:hypothetical protein